VTDQTYHNLNGKHVFLNATASGVDYTYIYFPGKKNTENCNISIVVTYRQPLLFTAMLEYGLRGDSGV